MQFLRNGPDIPSRLLNDHEDGQVAFFVGAGVSCPAGLPLFGDLVELLFAKLHETPNAVQEAAKKAGQYDTAIMLLEEAAGSRWTVRRHLSDILTPKSDEDWEAAMPTHEALLTLATARDGLTHLVTTNFDRLFEEANSRRQISVQTDAAPHVPLPKARWNSLVYLHGLLTEEPTEADLNRLVVSSGDFGLAYLTEGWAGRFVTELFRNYTVCFVGYSIDDPILRYMLDALAAERLLGEPRPEMFAFAPCGGDHDHVRATWEARHVKPIPYDLGGANKKDHSHLHNTLRHWASIYQDGIGGKRSILTAHAHAHPVQSTVEDDFVARMLWALSDPSGSPASTFADLDVPPPLEWLEFFCHDENSELDLRHLRSGSGSSPEGLTPVVGHLLRWLIRYLDKPDLLLWFAEGGTKPHPRCAHEMTGHLDHVDKLLEDELTELDDLKTRSPRTIPRPALKTAWRLLLAGRVTSWHRTEGSWHLNLWRERIKREGLTTALRLELRDLLMPRLRIRRPWIRTESVDSECDIEVLSTLLECDVVLGVGKIHDEVDQLVSTLSEMDLLPGLLDDFNMLLGDAHALLRSTGAANEQVDHSHMSQPSIASHGQNRGFDDWTALIDLVREAWLATLSFRPTRAKRMAEDWASTPYPLYRRLSFFAASRLIEPLVSLEWLLANDARWLWSLETRREAIRLLVDLAGHLDAPESATLQEAILRGPPVLSDPDDDEGRQRRDRAIWLRLAKLAAAGHTLTPNADVALGKLSSRYPVWQVAEDERDEFPFWMEDSWTEASPEGERDGQKRTVLPRDPEKLLSWFRESEAVEGAAAADWPELCRSDFQLATATLKALADEGRWPLREWRDALLAWSDEDFQSRSWEPVSRTLEHAPDSTIAQLAWEVSRWLRATSGTLSANEEVFLTLCRRALEQSPSESEILGNEEDPVLHALNHPAGYVVEGLFRWWTRNPLRDGQQLPDQLQAILTAVCDTTSETLRHGRVWIAVNTILLFRVDRPWAMQYLLPLFDWERSEAEARAAWAGFLWAPRLYFPLLESVKQSFLETATHYSKIGDYGRRYASFLAFVALNRGDVPASSELKAATAQLPEEGLEATCHFLLDTLKAAEGPKEKVWRRRIRPYFESTWPRSCSTENRHLAHILARICVATEGEFSNAVDVLKSWLEPLEFDYGVCSRLGKTDLANRFPQQALDFLYCVIDEDTHIAEDLTTCLRRIASAAPELVCDHRFAALREFARARGWEVET